MQAEAKRQRVKVLGRAGLLAGLRINPEY